MDAEDLSQLSLFPATAEQVLEARKRGAVQWARGLPLDIFLKVYGMLDMHECANDGKLITWVLAPRNDPFTLDFKCSCETFRRVGIVARPTSDGQAQVAEVPCYGVASVYTPPEKRKKGYAAHMMRLLHWVLAPEGSIPAEFPAEWGTPPVARLQDGIFSVLYSDIGDQFYRLNCSPLPKQDLGWMTTGQINTTWPAAKMPLDSAQWVFLSKEEADKVWEEDAQLMKKDALAVARTGGVACSFLPDRGNGRLSYERHRKLKNGLTLEAVGVQLARNSPEDPLVFATWAAESSESLTLVLTRLRATKETFGGLLAQIMAFAERHGVDMIETWNLPENLSAVAKELGGHTFKRNNHLSAIKWYGPEAQNEVKWMFNEKFCWC